MYSRVTFLIIITLVCMSVMGTFILVTRFTREEYQPAPISPSLPEIPKEEVKEVVFQYTPDVYRDPFKAPVRIAIEKPREETPPISKPVISVPSQTLTEETKPKRVKPLLEAKPETKQIRANREIKEIKEEGPPKLKVTGILYDEEPFAIIEFEGRSGIFEMGDKLSKDLIVRKIYIDSVDLDWRGKTYNIKLGG
ncbi:MAG: hypothetical protein ACP5K2_03855 [bacterium]